MRDAVVALAVLGILMLGSYLMLRRRRPGPLPRHVAQEEGGFALAPPRRNAILLGISLLIPTVLLGLVTIRVWTAGTSAAGHVAGIAATALVLALAAYQFAAAFRVRTVVHDIGLKRFGVFRQRLIGWRSIAKIAYNPAQHWFFITVADGSHLWLPADVAGMGDFAIVALRRLPPPALEADPDAREVLEQLAGAARDETREG